MINRAGWRCTVSVFILSSIAGPSVLAAEDIAQEQSVQADDHSYLPPWMLNKGNGGTSNASAKSASASGAEHAKSADKNVNTGAASGWSTTSASSPKDTVSASDAPKALPFRQFGDNIIRKFASLFQ